MAANRKRVVITEFMDPGSVAWLAERAEVRFEPDLVDRPDDLLAALGEADALIVRNRTQVRGPVLEALAAARISVVGRLGVGLDNIDMEGCAGHGIRVIPATGANAVAVAEYVIATMMTLLRGAYSSSERVLGGEWPRQALMGGETMGRTLGLLGFGGIAQEVAPRARALGMALSAADPFVALDDPAWDEFQVTRRDLDHLLAESHVISLHLPLTEATPGDDRRRPSGADEEGRDPDQHLAGRHRRRGGAGPGPGIGPPGRRRHRRLRPRTLAAGGPLTGAPNIIATPHIAGVTHEGEVRIGRMIVEAVWDILEGDGAGTS